jgi:hypothetical protein
MPDQQGIASTEYTMCTRQTPISNRAGQVILHTASCRRPRHNFFFLLCDDYIVRMIAGADADTNYADAGCVENVLAGERLDVP